MQTSLNASSYSAERMAGEALLWLERMSAGDKWSLTRDEMANLLGDMPVRTLSRQLQIAKETKEFSATRDVRDRLSILLGIYKALSLVAPKGQADEFFKRSNTGPMLRGKSIKQFLLDDSSMESLISVRAYLKSQMG